jgi:hypothetical protein
MDALGAARNDNRQKPGVVGGGRPAAFGSIGSGGSEFFDELSQQPVEIAAPGLRAIGRRVDPVCSGRKIVFTLRNHFANSTLTTRRGFRLQKLHAKCAGRTHVTVNYLLICLDISAVVKCIRRELAKARQK